MQAPDIANQRAIRQYQRQSPPTPPHPKPTPTPTIKPAAPPYLLHSTAGSPERKATTRVIRYTAKNPLYTG